MGLIVGLVFVGVFTIIALPLIANALSPSRSSRQAIVALDTALKSDRREKRISQEINIRKNEMISSIPWLNKTLLKLELTPKLRRMLIQAGLNWNPGRLLVMTAAGFIVPFYLLHLYLQSYPIPLVAGLMLGATPISIVLFKRSRRMGQFEKGLPEALNLMVSGLRAGHSLLAAMALVSRECADPIGSEFKVCFEEQNYGLELNRALDNMLLRVPLQDMMITATAIIIQKESGGNLAEVLDKTAHVIRERFRLKRQIMVHTAQGRLTGWILTLLPVVLGIAIYFVDPGMISILWHRDVGIKMLWGAAGMTALGGFVIHKIVDIDV